MEKQEKTYKHNYILLIDDVELDNFINEKMIKNNGFAKNVYVTTNAPGALQFLDNLAIAAKDFPGVCPSVIFVDINMPVMDGFEFIQAFRKSVEKQARKPKLVVLTSSAAPIDREKTHTISKDIVFLNKPLTQEMLDSI